MSEQPAPDQEHNADTEQRGAEQPAEVHSPTAAGTPAESAPARQYPPESFNTLYWCYLGLSIGAIALAITIVLSLLAPLAAIAGTVCAAVFLFRAWDQIQDGEARTTPGLAVGLMFVPLFNFYWAFIALWGLAKGMNAYAQRHNIDAHRANDNLALGLCVLFPVAFVLGFVPILNIIVWIVWKIVALLTFNEFRKTSMAIAASAA